jgi:ribosomal protein S17
MRLSVARDSTGFQPVVILSWAGDSFWFGALTLLHFQCRPPSKKIHFCVQKVRTTSNHATHKHPAVQRWLKRHPRFHIHFRPTSASWPNMVERFFRDLTVNRLRRDVFRDVMELVNAIDDYVDHHNEKPKPFIWTASANDILEKVKRVRKGLVTVQSV